MMGMEKMLAGMLGITPDEMQAHITEFTTLLKSLNSRLSNIEAQQAAILSQIEGTKSDDDNHSSGNASAVA